MTPQRWSLAAAALVAALTLAPRPADALDVQVWTDRGNDAVYDPGEIMQVRVRASEDAFVIVYELDAEGYVRMLFPYRGSNGLVPGGEDIEVPDPRSNVELVVQDPVGQAYIVAIASYEPFQELPWYLRPYDAQGEEVGYEGEADDEEGITAEGRIVGDPFVAMERIRRSVLEYPDDADEFATSYTSYYVHQEVKYPRYLCYDCHRPGHWAWWTDFDPYYASCSVFHVRVNYSWYWGPGYWFGYVPYYWYVPRHDCAPVYQTYSRYSPWGGWSRWKTLWGTSLVRYKTAPPANWTPPPPKGERVAWRKGAAPPGFITRGAQRIGARIPIGRRQRDGAPIPAHEPGTTRDPRWREDRGGPPAREGTTRAARPPRVERRSPGVVPRDDLRGDGGPGRVQRPDAGSRRGRFDVGRGTRMERAPRQEARFPERRRTALERGSFTRESPSVAPRWTAAAPPVFERPPQEPEAPRVFRGAPPSAPAPRFERGPSAPAPRVEQAPPPRVEHAPAPRVERAPPAPSQGDHRSASPPPGKGGERGRSR